MLGRTTSTVLGCIPDMVFPSGILSSDLEVSRIGLIQKRRLEVAPSAPLTAEAIHA